MAYGGFIVLILALSLSLMIGAVVAGLKGKSADTLTWYQTLPTVVMWGVIAAGLALSEWLYPNFDEHGASFGFLVMLPTVGVAVITTMILGIKGLTQLERETSLFRKGVSFFAVLSPVSFQIGMLFYPVLFLVQLGKYIKGSFIKSN